MFGIEIDRKIKCSLICQFCEQLRSRITDGSIPGGTRLPSTRILSKEYAVSRNIIVEVYEQLQAEGYLDTRTGSGSYVKKDIQIVQKEEINVREKSVKKEISRKNLIDFDLACGIPDFRYFPVNQWKECSSLALVSLPGSLENSSIMGDMDLRKAISGYLYRSKGISAEPERIMITSGITDACLLLSYHFKNDFSRVIVEDPSWDKLREIFRNNDYEIFPVRTDEEGLCVNDMGNSMKKSLLLVTPSHQYPTGTILSIQRRILLIDRANEFDSYVLENDYDGEFRLKGVSIPPLHSLCQERVIYMATFSKCLFPGIRLGYMVVPHNLVEKLRNTKKRLSMIPSSFMQRTLLHFFTEGYFERHILRMKKVYAAKRVFLEQKIPEILGNDAAIGKNAAGVYLSLDFSKRFSRQIDWKQSVNCGISISSFEEYSLIPGNYENHVVLGYGNLTEKQMLEGLHRLRKFLDDNKQSGKN